MLGLLPRWSAVTLSSLLDRDDYVQSEDAVSLLNTVEGTIPLPNTDLVGRRRGCEGVCHSVMIEDIGIAGLTCLV